MPEVEVAVGFGGETGHHPLNAALRQVGIDNVANEIDRGGGGCRRHEGRAAEETPILATLEPALSPLKSHFPVVP